MNYSSGHVDETGMSTGRLIQPNLDDIVNPGTAPGNGNVIDENYRQKEDEMQSTICDVRVIKLFYYID